MFGLHGNRILTYGNGKEWESWDSRCCTPLSIVCMSYRIWHNSETLVENCNFFIPLAFGTAKTDVATSCWKSLMMFSAVSTEYRRVTDGRTDGQTDTCDSIVCTIYAQHRANALKVIFSLLPVKFLPRLNLQLSICVETSKHILVLFPPNSSFSMLNPVAIFWRGLR